MKKHRIGLVGTGGIANGVHLPGIAACPDLELAALCDIDGDALKQTAQKWGIDEAHCFTDYRKLISCPDVDAVDITTPNDSHVKIAWEAVAAGKPFSLEKPIGLDAKESAVLLKAVKEKNLPHMVCFSYRFKEAARFARAIVQSGQLGDIYQIDMQYFQAWANPELDVPMRWRFQKSVSGSGALGDLGTHGIDLIRFITGKEYLSVCGQTATVLKERRLDGGGVGKVDVDDLANYFADMEGGICASFLISRLAFGRGNYQRLEIYGSKGALVYKLDEEPGVNSIEVCIGEPQRDTHTFTRLPVPRQYFADQAQSFADILSRKGDGLAADLEDGHRAQLAADAVLVSAQERKWVDLQQLCC
ncbi:MAG: Gfo/Idh/MocA family oxidoreductase [Oscillospiraceae bacterium]|nr:Gfo/Idh/MocA family oxidoreductase [Oscillospiraceae bacterium]